MLSEHSVVCPVLVGRGAPLSAVVAVLDRARTGQGDTLLISGEAGIGKSRLVRAMMDHARELGFVVLQGACFEADRSQPYAPILDLVRALSTTASPSVAAHYLEAAGGELVTFFPELRSIFRDAPVRPTLDPEEDRRRLFHSFTAAVNALGRRQPVLVVIEDVHWSDDATLDLVLHLARRIATSPVTLALSFRSDELGPRLSRLLADLDHARCASEIGLRPLGAAEVAIMLQAIFGSQAFGSPFVDRLYDLTEGNPFFVEEMLKSLLVAGDLERTDGIWRARPLEHVHVPRTATEAVGRRLSALPPPAREVASVAAVAGRRFDFAILQRLTGHNERELLSLIKELVVAQLVVEESADRFAFRHALTRETIRARLLARERVALHRAIALVLEETSGRAARDVDDALAYHAFEAGMWEPARRYALRAAEHAIALCAPREALQQFDRAVTATSNAGLDPEPPLLIARGRAHETLGAFARANEDFSAALSAARAAGDLRAAWSALHALGMLWAARDYVRAGRYRREALELARTIGDPPLIAHSLNRVGNWYVNREAPQAGIPHHDEALAIFEGANDIRGVAETVDLLAMAHHVAGSQDAAVRLYERSVDLFTDLEDRRGLANALSVLAGCGPSYHACAGPVVVNIHTPDLLANERPVRLSTEIGWRAGEAFSRYIVADALAWRGAFDRALRLARESLGIARELEHLEWQCGARRVLGTIALDLCAPADAVSHLEQAHDLAKRLGSAIWARWTAAPLAIALLRAGDAVRATAILGDVDRTLSESAVSPLSKGARRTLGERYLALARAEIALALGDPTEALAAIDPRDVPGTPRALLLRGQALAAQERWSEAIAALDAARAEAERQGARPLLWRVDAAQGAIHLKGRRRLEARRSFEAARSLAAELVSSVVDAPLAAAFRAGVDELAPPPSNRTANQTAKEAYGGLTPRERDTAALIARGKSNRAVARALGIGERTVEGYVAAALSKLGFSSRAQIAVWATERGLVKDDPATGRSRR
jgi:DNA-binding CsgD family transcriptional regulator